MIERRWLSCTPVSNTTSRFQNVLSFAFEAARLPVLNHSAGRGARGSLQLQQQRPRQQHIATRYYYHHHHTRAQGYSDCRPSSITTTTAATHPTAAKTNTTTTTVRLLSLSLGPTSIRRNNNNDNNNNKMASDEDYMAFLNKANQDPNEGIVKKTEKAGGDGKKKELKTTDDGAQVPAVILEATKDAFYVSDADEPFVPVCLAWNDEGGKKGLPDEEEFATLIQHPTPAGADANIEILDPADWDPRGQYAAILDAVRKATRGGDARVYRVPYGGGARVEYWIVASESEGGRLVGAKALGVES